MADTFSSLTTEIVRMLWLLGTAPKQPWVQVSCSVLWYWHKTLGCYLIYQVLFYHRSRLSLSCVHIVVSTYSLVTTGFEACVETRWWHKCGFVGSFELDLSWLHGKGLASSECWCSSNVLKKCKTQMRLEYCRWPRQMNDLLVCKTYCKQLTAIDGECFVLFEVSCMLD